MRKVEVLPTRDCEVGYGPDGISCSHAGGKGTSISDNQMWNLPPPPQVKISYTHHVRPVNRPLTCLYPMTPVFGNLVLNDLALVYRLRY